MKSKKEQRITKYIALALALQLGAYGAVRLQEEKYDVEVDSIKSNERFDLKNLIVWKSKDIAGENHTYILEKTNTNNIYEEYHHNFKGIAKQIKKEYFSNPGEIYVNLDEYEPLYIYLTSDEQEKTSNGIITTKELDNISNRINKENNSVKILQKK